MNLQVDPSWVPLPQHDKDVQAAYEAFRQKYGSPPDGVWSAPGRLNLLGEYIDFLGGTCLPMPLPYRTIVAGKLRSDGVLRAASQQMPGDDRTIVIQEITPGTIKGWFTYVAGVAWAMNQEGGRDIALPHHFGADLLITSRVPVGGGLSSSAALEASVALALLDLSCPLRADCSATDDLPPSRGPENDVLRARLAQVCIRAENEVAGARTGGLDQTASLRSRAGAALAIDFRDFSISPLAIHVEQAGLAWLVVNTNTPHQLAGGQFAARREANERVTQAMGLTYLRQALPDDLAFAQLSEDQAKSSRLNLVDSTVNRSLAALEGMGLPLDFPRGWIRHTLHDMTLVERAVEVIRSHRAGDMRGWWELGRLMTESFISMRDELRVSRPEIDLAVQTCLDAGALGARLVGGGFGGAVMALVESHHLEDTAQQVALAYALAGYRAPEFLPMLAGEPAHRDL